MNEKIIELIEHRKNKNIIFSKIENPNNELTNILKKKKNRIIYSDDMEVTADMDENKILEKYMDKVDQDRRDQDERIYKNMQHMEQRITEERRLSEERLNKKYEDLLKVIEASNNNTNSKLEKLQSNFNDEIKEIKNDIKDNTKEVRNISITTILAIAAMVIAIVWAVYQQMHIS